MSDLTGQDLATIRRLVAAEYEAAEATLGALPAGSVDRDRATRYVRHLTDLLDRLDADHDGEEG